MTTCCTVKACPCQQSTHTGLSDQSLGIIIKRHTCGYIIIIDLLSWCLGLLVVDGGVEGALRLFGVPRLVSLRGSKTADVANHCLNGEHSLPDRGSLIGPSIPHPDLWALPI